MQINPNPDAITEEHRFREVAQLLGTALHRWHKLKRCKEATAAVQSSELARENDRRSTNAT